MNDSEALNVCLDCGYTWHPIPHKPRCPDCSGPEFIQIPPLTEKAPIPLEQSGGITTYWYIVQKVLYHGPECSYVLRDRLFGGAELLKLIITLYSEGRSDDSINAERYRTLTLYYASYCEAERQRNVILTPDA